MYRLLRSRLSGCSFFFPDRARHSSARALLEDHVSRARGLYCRACYRVCGFIVRAYILTRWSYRRYRRDGGFRGKYATSHGRERQRKAHDSRSPELRTIENSDPVIAFYVIFPPCVFPLVLSGLEARDERMLRTRHAKKNTGSCCVPSDRSADCILLRREPRERSCRR